MVWKISSKTKPLAIPEKKGYRLSQDVIYDSDARCFSKDAQKIILTPKGNLIVKALLEAENYQLHGADLLAKVWDSNETNMNKLYIQNTKLRVILKDLGDGFDIISMDRSHFRFIFPNMQEKHNILIT
jgi:DNA-binding winged helix-turn-helix (wHTH) protein